MADLQKYFREFHDKIAVKRTQEKALLSEKRERILRRLADGIARQRSDGATIPTYRTLNQGSYRMGTGIKVKSGEYDLDVAILFDLNKADYPDPVVAKEWVYNALKDHTTRVEMRRPCVTVFYTESGEAAYHVDLAIYAESNGDQRTYLALGKAGSESKYRVWDESDPEALIKRVDTVFSDAEDRKQFRRCVRYLKRWRDETFSSDGHAAPKGIALTACALTWFGVSKLVYGSDVAYDDHAALKSLVQNMLANFLPVYDAASQTTSHRLTVKLTVPPGNDLFARMTAAQMTDFRAKLETLSTALDEAKRDIDPHTAAKTVSKVLGDDFPVPEKVETAARRAPSIASSGNSG